MATRDEPSRPTTSGSLWRSYRSRAGLTQDALARRAEVTSRTIRDLESGKRQPSVATLRRLATALGLSRSDLDALRGNVPRQLPAPPLDFTGRTDELAALTAGRPATWLITGPGGMGKTWLALRWAHDNTDAFPDGQLYLNLRGFEPDQPPLSRADALRHLLTSLDVEGSAIPREVSAQTQMLADRLSGKRMLIVLDNASSAEQLQPLLTGTSGTATVITSRNDLPDLDQRHDIRRLNLTVFDESATREQLRQRLGEQRLAAEPEAVSQLSASCAGLPLAISLVATRAAIHPGFSLASLAAELGDRESRLDILATDELSTSLRSVFAMSRDQLSQRTGRFFALLGLVSASGIAVAAVARLTGTSVDETVKVLAELASAHLIEQHAEDRIGMHDLIHLYAAEEQLSTDYRGAALLRLVDHYLHTGLLADRRLAPEYQWRDLTAPGTDCRLTAIPDEGSALAWFAVEHANLLDAQRIAASHGWHDRAWKLAWIMRTVHRWQVRLDDELTMWRIGLASATRTGDAAAMAIAEFHMGAALYNLERAAEAETHLERGLELSREVGDLQVQGSVHYVRSLMAQNRNDWEACLGHSRDVLALARAMGYPPRIAEALNGVGWSLAHLGRYAEARAVCEGAVGILEGNDNVEDLADVWDSLGYIALREGDHGRAVAAYRRALAGYERLSADSYHVARVRECLAEAYAGL